MRTPYLLYRRAGPVLVLFAVAGLILFSSATCTAGGSVVRSGVGNTTGALLAQQDGQSDGFEMSDNWLEGYSIDAPAGFEEELFARGDAVYSESGQVLCAGFVQEGAIDAIASELQSELEQKGWNSVASGEESVITFVKGSGMYRWAAITCTEVNGSVSAVVTARRYSDG